MKPQDINELAAGVQPAIYSDGSTAVFAFNLHDLNLFARAVLNKAGKRLTDRINDRGWDNGTDILEPIKTLRDE